MVEYQKQNLLVSHPLGVLPAVLLMIFDYNIAGKFFIQQSI